MEVREDSFLGSLGAREGRGQGPEPGTRAGARAPPPPPPPLPSSRTICPPSPDLQKPENKTVGPARGVHPPHLCVCTWQTTLRLLGPVLRGREVVDTCGASATCRVRATSPVLRQQLTHASPPRPSGTCQQLLEAPIPLLRGSRSGHRMSAAASPTPPPPPGLAQPAKGKEGRVGG